MGNIIVEKERCKGCGLCISTCPKKSIKLSEDFNGKGYHFIVFNGSGECTGCTMCGRICPDMAIEVYKET
jgi:2-oxoglutarate ferredoxin oxidoreductase subunit delta